MKPLGSQLDSHLRAQSRQLEQLTALLRSDLPAECDGHYHVASVRDQTVCLVTDSPVWTTRLRQLGPQILQILLRHGHSRLLHVRIISRMAPAAPRPAPAVVKRQLSPTAGEQLRQSARYIKDTELSKALQRLSRHSDKNS